MAQTKGRLYKDTHRLGFNTRDNPQDVPKESGLMLVNAFPGHPSCFPRDGVVAWNSSNLAATPTSMFPWADNTEPKVIVHIAQDLYWQVSGSSTAVQIASGVVPAGAKLSAIRVKDMMFINTNYIGANHKAWIISWNGTTFVLRNANISRPTFGLGVYGVNGGNISPSACKSYAFTFINRSDADSVDYGGAPKLCRLQDANFHPGLLESADKIGNRRLFTNSASITQAAHLIADMGVFTLDPQITHLRIYATLEAETEEIASGLAHRWIADVPVKGSNAYSHPYVYEDTTTIGMMAGALDINKMVGYDDMVPGTYMLYHQGIIWIGGVGSGEDIGRNFYSETPLDVEFPQKWCSMFRTGVYFKDTSYEDSEPGTGIGVAQNDIYFFGVRSVWYLRDGDVGYEPTLRDKNKGTQFGGSITSVNQDILYLSNDGPTIISNREITVLQEHTAGEVWPKLHDNSKGYFFTIADRTKVKGFYFRESWFLTDGIKMIGFYMPSKSTALGPWALEFADSAIGFDLVVVLNSENLCVIASTSISTTKLWSFLKAGGSSDNGTAFWLKGASKAYYIDAKNRDKSGELYTIKLFAHYEDAAVMHVTLKSDFFRFIIDMEYNEYGTTSALVSPDAKVSFRNIIEQPIPEGLIGQFFEVEWRKLHQAPYSFTHKGWILEYKPVDGHPSEFISKSVGDNLMEEHPDSLIHLRFDENVILAKDSSIYSRDHSYNAGSGGSRTFLPTMVPGGGQSLAGAAGSGYYDAPWNGMDFIGSAGGLNGSSLTYEWVFNFPSLSSSQTIEEGGDGTHYWRMKVNADGSMEYQLKTSLLSLKFTSPVGAILINADYFIQFVLSNQGLNGQFYGGPRTGSFNSYLTISGVLL